MLIFSAIGNTLPLIVIAFVLLVVLVGFNALPERVVHTSAQGRLSSAQLLAFYVGLVLVLVAIGAVCYIGRNDFDHVFIATYAVISFIVAIAGAISIAIEA